jgi:hypothetical protein
MEGPNPDGPAPISVLFSGFYNIKGVRKEVESIKSATKTDGLQGEQRIIDLWSLYMYAVKSPITRQKYQSMLCFSDRPNIKGLTRYTVIGQAILVAIV